MAENRRNVEVSDDVAGQPLERVEQHAHVEFPRLVGADVLVERREFRVVEGPIPVGPVNRVFDRDEVHRADQPSGRIASTMFCASGRARGSLSTSAPIE